MTRILVDLSHAADGYVGIAQDIRLIFAMLAGLPKVDAAGLLMPAGRHDLPRVAPGAADAAALTAAVLHTMQRNWAPPERRRFPLGLVQRVQSLRQLVRTRHDLLEMPVSQRDALWRVLFARSLPPDLRAMVLARPFYATDLAVSYVIDRVVHMPAPYPKYLHARDFDAVLFSMPRPVRLPDGVRQIVRFHDAVPITDVDTVQNWRMARAHSRLIRACSPDAIFVCNSPQSLASLLAIDPSRARHATVIPCALAPASGAAAGLSVHDIVARHLSFRAVGTEAPPQGWTAPPPGLRYILSVSTLEPRKNFPGLIQGWERARAADPSLHLVIVAGPGWQETESLAQLRPGVASGGILHLQNVPPDELQALMRACSGLVSVSFAEGFGLTPLEALKCGAPCLVSDLPVFRWILGDAATYVNPYDTDAIAKGIIYLVGVREQVAPEVIARFDLPAIRQHWQDLLQAMPGGLGGIA